MIVNAAEYALRTFGDASGKPARKPRIWSPFLVTREQIDTEVARLAATERPSNGRRASRIVHPQSTIGEGMAPGTGVLVQVLLPGEATTPFRTNANQLEISIRGSGRLESERDLEIAHHDVWTVPPMKPFVHRNTGTDIWVRLTYSNDPLLQFLGVLYEEEGEELGAFEHGGDGLLESHRRQYAWENAPDVPIGTDGARLRAYEFLTDIPVVDNRPLHWPWESVRQYKASRVGEDKRDIWLLYHPSTERRNGTTGSFFATIGGSPAGSPLYAGARGHRHTSASINYHMAGSGHSIVDGIRVDWNAGDLLLSAPGWSEHAHYHGDEGWTVLTVQDHPLHIAMGSLLWQERYDGPILTLGSEPGQKGYVAPRKLGD